MRASPEDRRGAGEVGSRRSHFWGLATPVPILVAVASACSPTKPTELVPGVLTQVQVPKNLSAIQVEVEANGDVVYCPPGQEVDPSGTVLLPETLGVVSGQSAATTVVVTIRGYDQAGATVGNYLNCPDNTPAGMSGAPRVLRTSIQTFVDQHTLFLPMPLSYSCYDVDCSAPTACLSSNCVCKGAQCVDSTTDAHTLADFDPTLINGTGICFDPTACFQGAMEAQLVDPATCLYAALPGAGINVRVFYNDVTVTQGTASNLLEQQVSDPGESEILSEDPQEGFCVGSCATSGGDAGQDGGPGSADAALPSGLQTFQLAPGLCALAQAATSPPPLLVGGASSTTYRTISSVQVASDCPAKSSLLPICKNEQTNSGLLSDGAVPDGESTAVATSMLIETADGAALTCGAGVPLASTPSAIYLIMDDSSVMSSAFGSSGYATVMSLSLANPIFDTTYAAFRFFPESPSDAGGFDQSACTSATTAFSTPTVPFGVATQVQSQIAALLSDWSSPGDTPTNPAPLDLQAALRPDGAYAAVRSFLQNRETPNIAAVMAFVNRTPDTTNDCNPPLGDAGDVKTAIEAEIQAAYNDTPSVQTYFVVLANSSGSDGSSNAYAFYSGIEADLPQMVTVINATLPMADGGAQEVLANFAKGVEPLATCLYETIPGASITELGYTDPTNPQNLISIPASAQCTSAQATVDGWGLDNGRVRVCGPSCVNVQNAILAAEALQEQTGVPSSVTVDGTLSCGGGEPAAEGGSFATDASNADATAEAAGDGSLEFTDSGSSSSSSSAGAASSSSSSLAP
jgi:hypothetical protein